MQAKEYIVAQRARHWCVACADAYHGPYMGRQAAIDSAVTMAKNNFSHGVSALVVVNDDGQLSRVYDSTTPK